MSALTAAAAALALLAVGYALGAREAGPRLLSWAEDAATPGWKTWKFWPAVPIILVALAWIWTVHPRRTLANVRAWKQPPPPRGPAIRIDSDWAAKRRAAAQEDA